MRATRIRAAVAVLAGVVGLALGGCDPQKNGDTGPARPAMAPLEVVDYAFARSGTVGTYSVDCIPADTTPFTLAAATYWREVQVGEQGPDGPDGNWAQHRPCPTGKVLLEWPPGQAG